MRRDYSRQMQNQFPLPNEEQKIWVKNALGRKPDGLYRVAKTDSQGRPMVLQVPPLIEGKPFPTVFWLCYPALKKQIDHLEARGLVKALEQKIQQDDELLEKIAQDHERYRTYRWSLLSSEDIENCDNPNKLKDLKEKGIGGVADWRQIRCLHMHYAHHLVQGNTLGSWLEREYL